MLMTMIMVMTPIMVMMAVLLAMTSNGSGGGIMCYCESVGSGVSGSAQLVRKRNSFKSIYAPRTDTHPRGTFAVYRRNTIMASEPLRKTRTLDLLSPNEDLNPFQNPCSRPALLPACYCRRTPKH